MENKYKFYAALFIMSISSFNGMLAEKVKTAPQTKLKIFVNDFGTKEVDQDLGLKLTNTLSRKFSETYPDSEIYTHKTLELLKKEVEKQLMENKNCNAEKCQRKISSTLDTDYTVSGDIMLNKKNQKLIVNVMVIFKTEDDFANASFSVEFYHEQFEYFADEIKKKGDQQIV